MLLAATSLPTWGAIVFVAVLSGLAAGLGTALAVRPRRSARLVAVVAAGALAPLAWLMVVRSTGAASLLDRLGLAWLPLSWAAAVAGVATLGAVAMALGLGPDRREPAQRVLTLALGCGLAATGVVAYLL